MLRSKWSRLFFLEAIAKKKRCNSLISCPKKVHSKTQGQNRSPGALCFIINAFYWQMPFFKQAFSSKEQTQLPFLAPHVCLYCVVSGVVHSFHRASSTRRHGCGSKQAARFHVHRLHLQRLPRVQVCALLSACSVFEREPFVI